MSVLTWQDCAVWGGAHVFTSETNNVALDVSVAELDANVFGQGGYVSKVGGLKTLGLTMNGWWEGGGSGNDAVNFAYLGESGRVFTFVPTGVEGELAYLWQAKRSSYSLGGEVGSVAPFTVTASGSDKYGPIRGALASTTVATAVTGAVGSVVELGAVSATQFIFATCHLSSRGTTLTLQIQSDDNAGFSSPTTRATLGPMTSLEGHWLTPVAGPVTDTYWRVNVSTITGSHTFAAGIGIG